jgi:NADPH:quinone reductase
VRVEREGPDLSKRIAEAKKLDAVLDLVGNSTIKDFNPLLQMSSGVYLTFFGSFVFGTPGFPLSDVPLQEIAQQVAAGRIKAKPWRVFRFDEVREAHRLMEAREARGKMVVVHA